MADWFWRAIIASNILVVAGITYFLWHTFSYRISFGERTVELPNVLVGLLCWMLFAVPTLIGFAVRRFLWQAE
jgi:hypothetical protein